MSGLAQRSQLALHGGSRMITRNLRPYNPYGVLEALRAQDVIRSGVLSGFVAEPVDAFYGGSRVRAFERAWADMFETEHAVSVNSGTSGLIAALGAVGVKRGDEVIVSPWTMSATATAAMTWGATPVFADIEPDTFCLDPHAVEAAITQSTAAIVVTDIFGHAARQAVFRIGRECGIPVIEDAAQAPWALTNDKRVGTVGDIGVYSLNRHKHIHTGEGGVCVTDNDEYAERMRMIRNHGETVSDDPRMIGFNFRLGEIEAALGLVQLRKLSALADGRSEVGRRLSAELDGLPGLSTPIIRMGCTHVFYLYPIVLALDVLDVPRTRIAEALRAEGVPINEGYQNLHRLPIHAHRYPPGSFPVAERLHNETLLTLETCAYQFTQSDIEQVGAAFRKVWENLDQL